MQQSLFASAVQQPVADFKDSKYSSPDTPIVQAVFTVLDLETTGLNASKNAITEITAIQFQNGEELDKFSTLVKPTEEIPEEVEAITGISNAMVAHSPALVMALSDLCAFVGPSPIIVGHNVLFDIRFLQEKLMATGLGSFADRFSLETALCTKVLAQKVFPGLPSYEGVVVANHCGIYNANPHRAEYDVRMSAGILFKLINVVKEEQTNVNTIGQLMGVQGSLGN